MARDPASSWGGESSAQLGFQKGRVGVPGAGDEREGSHRGSGDCSESWEHPAGDPRTPKLPRRKTINGKKGLERLTLPPLRHREELRGAPASRKFQGMRFGSAAPQRPDPTAALLILKRTGGAHEAPRDPHPAPRAQEHPGVPPWHPPGRSSWVCHRPRRRGSAPRAWRGRRCWGAAGRARGAPSGSGPRPRRHSRHRGTMSCSGSSSSCTGRGQVGDQGVESSVSAMGT